MAEPSNDNLNLSTAEIMLLELLRGQDSTHFSLAVVREGEKWIVVTKTLDASPAEEAWGKGSNFDDAWIDQADVRLRGWMTLRERTIVDRATVIEGGRI